jgi:hypothetical protein
MSRSLGSYSGKKHLFIFKLFSFEASSLLIDTISFEEDYFSLFSVTIFLQGILKQNVLPNAVNFLHFKMNPLDVYMRFMVPIVMKVNIVVLKEMTPYFSGDGYRRFGAPYHFYPEEGSSIFLQNFGVFYQITRRPVSKDWFKIWGSNTFLM